MQIESSNPQFRLRVADSAPFLIVSGLGIIEVGVFYLEEEVSPVDLDGSSGC